MSETLFSATRAIARIIPGNIVVDGAATADGSNSTAAVTISDTNAWYVSPTTLPAADYFNGGTIWFDDCTSTGLEKRTLIITDYTSTGLYTCTTTSSTTFVPKAGDTYSAANRNYPRFILRQAVNYALANTGGVDSQNSTGLTTVADQEAYTLPSGVFNVARVELASNSTSPWGYVELNHWREIGGTVKFEDGFQPTTTGDRLRLTYRTPMVEISNDTSPINDLVDMNYLKWAGVAYCLRWKLGLTDGDERVQPFLEEALLNAEKNERRYRVKLKQTPMMHQHARWGGGVIDTDSEVDSVRI